jgi:cytochrome oxidase assembly protein ShyY1
MKRPIPIIPTLIVLAAAAIMIRLGFWQLDRLHQKEAMLARYAAAESQTGVSRWPGGSADLPPSYSRVASECFSVSQIAAQAGQNAAHDAGWAQVAECTLAQGIKARVVLGWGTQPGAVAWRGGPVTGTFVAREGAEPIIVADPPLAGLQANARPDPRDIPNNHLAYAVQWFLFAGVALVIYALALRKRMLG